MSQQGQPVSVLLHTVGYLLLLHAPSYYSYYILGKWVTASIAPPSTIHSPIRLPSRHRYGSEYTFLRSGSQVNQPPHSQVPPSKPLDPAQHAHPSPTSPSTFRAIINPDFCQRGIFRPSQTRTGAQYGSKGSRDGEKLAVFASARNL